MQDDIDYFVHVRYVYHAIIINIGSRNEIAVGLFLQYNINYDIDIGNINYTTEIQIT